MECEVFGGIFSSGAICENMVCEEFGAWACCVGGVCVLQD